MYNGAIKTIGVANGLHIFEASVNRERFRILLCVLLRVRDLAIRDGMRR